MKKFFITLKKMWKYNRIKDFEFNEFLTINISTSEVWFLTRYFYDFCLTMGSNEFISNYDLLDKLCKSLTEFIPNKEKSEAVEEFKTKLTSYRNKLKSLNYDGYIYFKKRV